MEQHDDRRYSREEMRKLLEAASRPEDSTSPVRVEEDGFTLAEIQGIARQVGIDPDRVERASRSLATDTAIQPRVSLGTYQRERRFGRRLTADEMRFLAEEADGFFGVRGRVRQTTDYVEWHSREAHAFVGIVNRPDGARVRVIIDRTPQFYVGAGLLGFVGLAVLPGVATEVTGSLGVLVFLSLAVATVLGVVGFWKWRRNSVLSQLDELLDYLTEGPVSL